MTRVPPLAHSVAMMRPTAVEPVKVTSFTRGSSIMTRATVGPSPGTTLNTPAGTPARSNTSASLSPRSEVSSEGLRTNVFPAASANAVFFSENHGKLNGEMPATTP
jgi:hypothetical protein